MRATDKRLPPADLLREKRKVSMPLEDWAYAQRLAAERKARGQSNASVSGVLRMGLHGMRALRHEVAGKRQALSAVGDALRLGALDPLEAAGMIRRISDELGELLDAAESTA